MMNNYARGANKERSVIRILLKDGFSYASRVAGSHSEFDVCAASPNHTCLVQAKSTQKPPKGIVALLVKYKEDIEKINALDIRTASKELWVFFPRKKPLKIYVLPRQYFQKLS